MSRYIDADELLELYEIDFTKLSENMTNAVQNMVWNVPLNVVKQNIIDQPTADVRKNIRAQKVLAGGILDGTTHWYECSCCHGAVDILDAYCKHCGAVLEFERGES